MDAGRAEAGIAWDPKSQWLPQLLALTQGKSRDIPSRQQFLDIHQCAWESIPLPHWVPVMKGWQGGFASAECLRKGPGRSEEEKTQIYGQREGGGQTLPGP